MAKSLALSRKQQRFVDEVLVTLNCTQAYSLAYPRVKNANTAGVLGFALLRNPKISVAIDVAMQERSQRTQISADQVLIELARLAFSDVRSVYDEQGNLTPIHQLDEDVARAIAGWEVSKHKAKIRFGDKVRALELLEKHLGLFVERVELKGSLTFSEILREIDNEEGGKMSHRTIFLKKPERFNSAYAGTES